jgi:hypothetical protein
MNSSAGSPEAAMESHQPDANELEADFVVVGGGLSGLCAAIAAAREGAKTVIVQDRPVFGGNSSSEVRMHVCGADINGARPFTRETGLIEEIRLENQARNPQRSASMWDLFLWEKPRAEPNLRFYLNTSMIGCEVGSGRIRAIDCFQSRTEKKWRVRAKYFMDATGDATLCHFAGAATRTGREAKSDYGESLAPDKADPYVMGSTLLFQARDCGRPMPFERPSWAREFPTEQHLPHRGHSGIEHGYWWIEWGGTIDIIKDDDAIRDELLAVLMGIWDHIKNQGDHGADNWALDWFGFLPGRRESRRVLAPYMLRQQDCQSGRVFEDAVAYGGWPLDDHPSLGIRSPDPPAHQVHLDEVYTIPLRSLHSRDIANLYVGGRCLGASHVAFSSTRVMATCAVIGQGAGTAAAYGVRSRKDPKEFGTEDITAVQQALLRNDAFIPGFPNQDPLDLARGAKVSSGSARAGMACEKVIDGWGRRVGDDWHCWGSEDYAPDRAWIEVRLPSRKPLRELHLTFDSNLERPMTLTQSDRNHARMIQGTPGTLVEAYRIRYQEGNTWSELVSEEGNHQRKRIHTFDGVTTPAVRIECIRSVKCEQARIQEVRWYA